MADQIRLKGRISAFFIAGVLCLAVTLKVTSRINVVAE